MTATVSLENKFLLGYKNKFVQTAYPIFIFQINDFESLKNRIVERADLIEGQLEFGLNFKAKDGETGVGGITRTHDMFNFFDLPGLEDLQLLLKESCKIYFNEVFDDDSPLMQKCWVNKLAPFKYMNMHTHIPDFLESEHNHAAVHLSIKSNPENCTVYVPTSNTLYQEVGRDRSFFQKNIEGRVTVFPGTLLHYTTPNISSEYRYSLAMDVVGSYGSDLNTFENNSMRAF